MSLSLLYTLDVIHPPHSNSPVRSSILWVRVKLQVSWSGFIRYKANLLDMFPCCCCSAMAWTRCCLGVWQKNGGGARDGDWRRWPSSSEVTFLWKSQGLVKNHSYFMQAVCTLLWIDCFETYMVVTQPLDLCYHEQSQEISVLTIWDL